jgi:hypothetical protein
MAWSSASKKVARSWMDLWGTMAMTGYCLVALLLWGVREQAARDAT